MQTKYFIFYNELCLSERIHSICSVVGMERSDGKLIPMKILVDGKENPIMKDCKDSDVLRFVPLYGNSDIELKYTVRELKEYCEKNGLPARAVPFPAFHRLSKETPRKKYFPGCFGYWRLIL